MLRLILCTFVLLFFVHGSTNKQDTTKSVVEEAIQNFVNDEHEAAESTSTLNLIEKEKISKRKRKSASKKESRMELFQKQVEVKTNKEASDIQEGNLTLVNLPKPSHALIWDYLTLADARHYLPTTKIIYTLLHPQYRTEYAFLLRQYFAWIKHLPAGDHFEIAPHCTKYIHITHFTPELRRNWYRSEFMQPPPRELTIAPNDRAVLFPYAQMNQFLQIPPIFVVTDVPAEARPNHLLYDSYHHRWFGIIGSTAFSFTVPCPLVFTTWRRENVIIRLVQYSVGRIWFLTDDQVVVLLLEQSGAFYPIIEVLFKYSLLHWPEENPVMEGIKMHCYTATDVLHKIECFDPSNQDFFHSHK